MAALEQYQPSWLERLGGGAEKKRALLLAAVESARLADAKANDESERDFRCACELTRVSRELAAAVLAGSREGFQSVLVDADPFGELRDMGILVGVTFADATVALASVKAQEQTIVPAVHTVLDGRGRPVPKKVSPLQGNQIYQDHLCSTALRVCRELFALLPLQTTVVSVFVERLNTQTGHEADMCLLSLIAKRDVLELLRFEGIDPSEAMRNFEHRMSFKKSAGMSAVSPFTLGDLAPKEPPEPPVRELARVPRKRS